MMNNDVLAKIIAFYFPQFHATPENDEWWGKGFTDWDNVRRGKPLFDGHNQPRIPENSNYYDQSKLETIKWQIELARANGISGFCHYHYWFGGKQMLQTPTNLLMENKELDMPFCLAWANETWSRRWYGQDHHVLLLQTHDPDIEKWKTHFDYLIRAWTDERAIRIDGKPVFIVYRPGNLIDAGNMFEYWREEARKFGLDGIYFVAMKQYEYPDPSCLDHFDAVIQFQPFEAMYSNRRDAGRANRLKRSLIQAVSTLLPRQAENILFRIRNRMAAPTLVNYDEVWSNILERPPTEHGLPTYPGAFVDWDNTARYGRRSTIFEGANPERFEYWLSKLVHRVTAIKNREPFIFLNAWNEWSEGTYLEPDERWGNSYLEALAKCVRK
jgi:lipopolysaccharide biosynthesis protein